LYYRQLQKDKIMATINRKMIKIQTPPAHQGFLGPDHTARAVINGSFSETDPFIILMDDILDKQNEEPVGGPHPHAGFETVTLLLEGEMGDSVHKMKEGHLQIMTAGSGVIHTESINKKAQVRILQLWLTLPKKDRWATPRVQDIKLQDVPKVSEKGLKIRLYSGSLAGITSPMKNYVPVIIANFQMQPGITTVQQIPASYNTFLYVIEGSVKVGEEGKVLNQEQVGWLDLFTGDAHSQLKLTAGESGARFVIYAGQPQGNSIVAHGPFIGDSEEDIKRLYQEYRQGKMEHISTVPETQRIVW
jgi:redox-sensitive bicupin YhaK (pirin superfamily)